MFTPILHNHALCSQAEEYPIKLIIVVLFYLVAAHGLSDIHRGSVIKSDGATNNSAGSPVAAPKGPMCISCMLGAGTMLAFFPALYCAGFVPLELYCAFIHKMLLGARLPFLPLMLTSMYCALGIGWVWVRMFIGYMTGRGYM